MMLPVTTVVIDVRCKDAYDAGHVPGSFSFPWARIAEDACGLPARNCDVLEVVLPAPSADALPQDVVDDGIVRSYFEQLRFPLVVLRHLPDTSTALTRSPPRGFCWSPNPFLAAHVESVETLCHGPGVALDVGSGSGRDLVFLAARGWTTIGVDNRRELAVRANTLAAKHGASDRVCNVLSDVSHTNSQGACVRPGSVDLLHMCRFIHRPSLAGLLRLVRPGGVVLYSHFLEGCEKTPVGRPKNVSGFFLRGELEARLVAGGLTVECSEEQVLHDGRPTINVMALKCV